MNPPARPTFLLPAGELTGQLVRDVLSLVGVTHISEDLADAWSPFERLLVYDWAMREHLAAGDRLTRRRPRPVGLLDA